MMLLKLLKLLKGSLAVLLLTFTSVCAAQTGDWVKIWNGKDMSGWEHVGGGAFLLDNGMLKTTGPKGQLGLFWYTREKLGNCVVRVVYKGELDNSNSGVYIRIPEKPTEAGMPIRLAHEVQIAGRNTGEIYALTKVDGATLPVKPAGQWNTLEITIDGPRTIVLLNGVKVTDYGEGDAEAKQADMRSRRPDEGYIGLQNHNDEVLWFREVSIRRLQKK